MALPVLSNDKPTYEVVIPSSQETFKFRPFLVKEQKSLLVAYESQDMKQILNAMLNCIETCVPGINVKDLATFDVDYIFTQVRAKSVGESATILSACVECNEENEVKIDSVTAGSSNAMNDLLGVAASEEEDIGELGQVNKVAKDQGSKAVTATS